MENLTLVIPAKNEKESLPKVLEEIKEYNCRKLVIMERSDIETSSSIKEYNCEILYQEGNGYGNAIKQGINSTNTKYFCIFNADGSFNPNELKEMLNKIKSYNFIFASRYEKNCGSEDDTIITLIGNYIFTKIGNIFFKLKITDILYTYVLGETEAAKKLNLIKDNFCLCVELPIKAQRANYKLATTKSFERKRIGGKKKVSAFKHGLEILIEMIKLYFK